MSDANWKLEVALHKVRMSQLKLDITAKLQQLGYQPDNWQEAEQTTRRIVKQTKAADN